MPLPATEQFTNNFVTTLNGAITNSATSITLTTATGAPSVPQWRIKIDNEYMLVTNTGSAPTYTVVRGIEGSTAASHSNGATVQHDYTAGAIKEWVPSQIPLPRHLKLLAWTIDPVACAGTLQVSSGQLQCMKVYIPQDITVTNILTEVQTAGVTLTANQNLAGIYSSAGAKLRETGDQATAWTSTGLKTMALTSTLDIVGGSDVWVYAVLLSVGTTTPFFMRGTTRAAMANAGLVAADGFRFGTILTGQTALPASFTVSSMTAGSNTIWIGLS